MREDEPAQFSEVAKVAPLLRGDVFNGSAPLGARPGASAFAPGTDKKYVLETLVLHALMIGAGRPAAVQRLDGGWTASLYAVVTTLLEAL